jgi:hypothetical protein
MDLTYHIKNRPVFRGDPLSLKRSKQPPQRDDTFRTDKRAKGERRAEGKAHRSTRRKPQGKGEMMKGERPLCARSPKPQGEGGGLPLAATKIGVLSGVAKRPDGSDPMNVHRLFRR